MSRAETAMGIRERLAELARIDGPATPVVSVYLNTRWADEHQRDRVRVFLKNETRRAREAAGSPGLLRDLAWVDAQGELLVGQARFPEARGVALFACDGLGLREALPVREPFDDAFVVADRPFLVPLATLLDEAPATMVVFVDGTSARLVPLDADGRGEDVTLEHEVERRHRRGGWALLAQSRYQRHIEAHRGAHFEAVAEALGQLARQRGVARIVLAGEARALTAFRAHLPAPLAALVVGTIAGARHEPAATLAARAAALVKRLEREEEVRALEAVLTEAAKGGRAVAGVEPTLAAAARGAIHRLYVLRGAGAFPGGACLACGALQPGDAPACRACGGKTRAVRLGDAVADRVIAADGAVDLVDEHPGLTRAGGMAARLRYPL
ncbi:MAG: hypothetical protein HY727_15460 [Candidatus Rokubacteria bacterium]|nr:hypothetical protein [Candidatus Rokubacteria bacterium]